MRAMILAAGRGERMGELTANTPKPLLQVNGHYLIDYAIASLVRAGIREIVINVSYLGDQIQAALGDGTRYGVHMQYSDEPERLEVGGGIIQALPLLGSEPFLVVSSDIVTDYPLVQLTQAKKALAHLIMVDNPAFHPTGDFGLRDGYVDANATPALTFASMGVYHPSLFVTDKTGHVRWSDIMLPAIKRGDVTGEHYQGIWYNVGSPQELAIANQCAPRLIAVVPI